MLPNTIFPRGINNIEIVKITEYTRPIYSETVSFWTRLKNWILNIVKKPPTQKYGIRFKYKYVNKSKRGIIKIVTPSKKRFKSIFVWLLNFSLVKYFVLTNENRIAPVDWAISANLIPFFHNIE